MRISLLFLLLFFLSSSEPYCEYEKIIVNSWRRIEATSSSNNGFASNNHSIFLGTLSDGHIYEYDYMNNQLYDRFKIHDMEKNKNSANSMIFTEINGQNYLFTATSFSHDRLPIIYVFDYDGTTRDNIPDLYLNCINVRTGKFIPENVHVFYTPVRHANNIYWGCYHDSSNPDAKILKLDITDVNNLKFEIIHFNEKANKTKALEIINDILFAATENGTIIRYNLTYSTQMTSIVVPKAREIPQLERDQNNNLWCMDAEEHRLFFIKDPTDIKSGFEILTIPINTLSRLYSSTNGWVYGQGFRVRYNNLKNDIDLEHIRSIAYSDFGILTGGFQLKNGGDSQSFLCGYNLRYKETDITKLNLKFANITTDSREPRIEDRILDDFEMPVVCQKLHKFAADNTGSLYLSCYWVGYNYRITPKADYPLNNNQREVLTSNNKRIAFQYDVIKPYSGGIGGGVLFGRYTGNYSSAFLDYRKTEGEEVRVQVPKAQENPVQYYSRITALTEDESHNVYVGTGEQTINTNTPEAAIFRLNENDLVDNNKVGNDKKIEFIWKDPSVEGMYPQPIRIISLLAHGDYLYGVGFNVQYINEDTKRNRTSFFRINLKNNVAEICTTLTSTMLKFADKILYKDGDYLILGFENKLLKYDLNNFQINSPVLSRQFNIKPITSVKGNSNMFFACTPDRILILDKNFNLDSEIQIPPLPEDDEFIESDILKGFLYSITKNGLLYRYAISQFMEEE